MLIDASSLVHVWDNYPDANFPRFWDWIKDQFNSGSLLISRVAYDEISHVSPECYQWLKDIEVDKIEVNNVIVREAMLVKEAVGIFGDKYHPKGVDENDIIIIATAKSLGCGLISNEAPQLNLPADRRKMKIPATCLQPTDSQCKLY